MIKCKSCNEGLDITRSCITCLCTYIDNKQSSGYILKQVKYNKKRYNIEKSEVAAAARLLEISGVIGSHGH